MRLRSFAEPPRIKASAGFEVSGGSSGRANLGRTRRPRYRAGGSVSSRIYFWLEANVIDRVLWRLQAQADTRGDLDWSLLFV